jgi:hypothetical protein
MKMIKTMRLPGAARFKVGLLAPLALACLWAAPYARAESILLAQTTLVNGSESSVDSFTAPVAGTVTVSLKSLKWPTALSTLSFSATSATQVLASWSGSGLSSDVATFDVGAGTYFAHIMATAAGAMGLGLYSLLISFNPSTPTVPLPSSEWMLLTGMFVLGGIARFARPGNLMGAAAA